MYNTHTLHYTINCESQLVAGIIGFAFAGSLKSLLFGGGAGVLYYGLYLSFGAMNSMTVAMVALGE